MGIAPENVEEGAMLAATKPDEATWLDTHYDASRHAGVMTRARV